MPESQNLIALLPETASTGEVFNIDEDGSIKKGQLRRFLKIMAPKLDEVKGLVDAMATMIDVDITDSDFLPHMAELVGVEFNREIPIPQQREEVKGAVQWYKRKGLLVGSRIHGYRVTRLQTDIVEFWRNIKTANRDYSFSTKNYGPTAMNFMLPGDESAFSYDYEGISVLERGNEFASSELPGFEAWHILDGREVTAWMPSSGAPAYWGYEFDEETLPLRFSIHADWGLETFRLQWSENGLDWFDAEEYVYGSVAELTQFLGVASGSAQTLVARRVPIASSTTPVVYEVLGTGSLSTVLQTAVEEGDTQLSLSDVTGLSADDWIRLSTVTGKEGYYQIDKIEGNIVTVTTGIAEPDGFPVLTDVRNVNVLEKTATTDYLIDTWEGLVQLLPGQFSVANDVFMLYTALLDKSTIGVWQNYEITTPNLDPRKWWRFYVDTTWRGIPAINEIKLYPEQFFGTFYRCERLGYFLTLGNARPGCKGQIICNNALTQETVEKLCRTMPASIPATAIPVIVVIDCRYPDTVNVDEIVSDRNRDEIHTRNREHYSDIEDVYEDVLVDRTLFSTYPGQTPIWGPPPYEDRGSPPRMTVDGEYFVSLIFPP